MRRAYAVCALARLAPKEAIPLRSIAAARTNRRAPGRAPHGGHRGAHARTHARCAGGRRPAQAPSCASFFKAFAMPLQVVPPPNPFSRCPLPTGPTGQPAAEVCDPIARPRSESASKLVLMSAQVGLGGASAGARCRPAPRRRRRVLSPASRLGWSSVPLRAHLDLSPPGPTKSALCAAMAVRVGRPSRQTAVRPDCLPAGR